MNSNASKVNGKQSPLKFFLVKFCMVIHSYMNLFYFFQNDSIHHIEMKEQQMYFLKSVREITDVDHLYQFINFFFFFKFLECFHLSSI